MTQVYLPHRNLTVVLHKRSKDAGTDLTVYNGTALSGNEQMTTVIATDIAGVLEDVFERANAIAADPLSKDLEGKSWRHIGYWLAAHLPRDGQLRRFVNEALKYLPKDEEHDPMDAVHQAGVEATLRARIATLEAETAQWARDVNSINRAREANEAELSRLRSERNGFNIRDNAMCVRIQKAEARIKSLEAEGVPALIGQRDAWRDIAQKLNIILCNQDPHNA